jgi:hypothetical protein
MAKKSKKTKKELNPLEEINAKKKKDSGSLQKLEIKNKDNYNIEINDLNIASYSYKKRVSKDNINKLFDNYKFMGLITEKYLPLLGIYSLEIENKDVSILIHPYINILKGYDNEILKNYRLSNVIKIDNDKKDLIRISMIEELAKIRAPANTDCIITFKGEMQKIIPYINELETVLSNKSKFKIFENSLLPINFE